MSNVDVAETVRVRPRWSTWGGGALALGAILLLAATIVEYFVWQTSTLATGVFVTFSILFLANALLYLVSMFALAFAGGGIVGSSLIGKIGLILFGLGWAVQQIIYWSSYYVDALSSAVEILNTIFLIITYVGAAAAAVIIALGRVVRGLARWALIIGFAIAAICAAIANASGDEILTTVLLSISCVAQAFVGFSYLTPRLASRA